MKQESIVQENIIKGRNEEVQSIIDRMPTSFGNVIALIVVILVIVLISLSWFIRYPDVVSGKITITSEQSAIKLIANYSGKIQLLIKKNDKQVDKGDYLAIIDNTARFEDVQSLKNRLRLDFSTVTPDQFNNLSRNLYLGELTTSYLSFLNARNMLRDFTLDNIHNKHSERLTKLLSEQLALKMNVSHKVELSQEHLNLVKKMLSRDSTLFSKKVISESEFEKTNMGYLQMKEAYENGLIDVTMNKENIQNTQNELQQNLLTKNERIKQLKFDFVRSLAELEEAIKAWEQKYILKSPIKGKLQFLRFWRNNEFVMAGDEIFSIVPSYGNAIGQMTLPSFGSGKVKGGQEVIIKLDNYPYQEYGSIKGKVLDISLISNPIREENGRFEDSYLIKISLKDGLKTNYGETLTYKHGIKGSADIITKDRHLLQRFFENLKYTLKK
jgi:multidrug resistance efflux pump